ncbi:MAG: hypothetical protein ACREEV_09630, partial [Dongiaceae bacterium]
VGLVLVLLGLRAGARGTLLRLGAIAVILAALANPALIEEQRKPIADVALIVIDDSDSMAIGERRAQVQAARDALKRRFGQQEGLEIREVVLPPARIQLGSERPGGTRLIEAMRSALVEVPPELGGAPVHALIAGRKNERDRLIVLDQAPRFGVVGREVTTRFKIEDPSDGTAPVTLSVGGEVVKRIDVPVGKSIELPITVGNPGANVVELEVAAGPNELTLDNNRALFTINGVRDRLRVLLVSGEPNPGERTWRNILKSDPAVDLVHFTILRPPEKQDGTPINELSLIAFPIRELFEVKLKEFDLIIFDRYRRRGVLPRAYFENIAHYVEEGGALLDAAGVSMGGALGLYQSPLGDVLPGEPTDEVIERGYRPTVTDIGLRHPVTADLPGGGNKPSWGRWFRLVRATVKSGNTVMSGPDNEPLLILNRYGKGRVAQLLSDQIWLWSRGYDGGGPQAELLRRVAHWLMKEPELEEEDLRSIVIDGRLEITRRSLGENPKTVEVTTPSGAKATVPLADAGNGKATGAMAAPESGLYRVSDGAHRAFAASGDLNPIELTDLRSTGDRLRPIVEATNGGIERLAGDGVPDIRRVKPGRDAAGRGWIGLRSNEDYVVAGVDQAPLLPAMVVLLLGLGATMLAWRREGR